MFSMCPECNGVKETRQLGNILAKCPTCKGVGVIDLDKFPDLISNNKVVNPVTPTTPTPKTTKDYIQSKIDTEKEKLKNANVAYLNRPTIPERKTPDAPTITEKPPVTVNPNLKQSPNVNDLNAPKPLNENDLETEKLRSEIKPRTDDMLKAQQATIPEKQKKEISKAKGKTNAKKK